MGARKVIKSLWGQHAEDCECAACELGGATAEKGRQRALNFEREANAAKRPSRAPRIEQTEVLLQKIEEAKTKAAPPPEGGFRAFIGSKDANAKKR